MDKGYDKEDKDMSAVVAKKQATLQEKLNRIRSKATPLSGESNKVELNPKNPRHAEWFNEDKYKGK